MAFVTAEAVSGEWRTQNDGSPTDIVIAVILVSRSTGTFIPVTEMYTVVEEALIYRAIRCARASPDAEV